MLRKYKKKKLDISVLLLHRLKQSNELVYKLSQRLTCKEKFINKYQPKTIIKVNPNVNISIDF